MSHHRKQHDALAEALLENETLDEADAYRVAGITRLTKDGEARDAEAAAAHPDAHGEAARPDA
jgi:cell division protease FtsH